MILHHFRIWFWFSALATCWLGSPLLMHLGSDSCLLHLGFTHCVVHIDIMVCFGSAGFQLLPVIISRHSLSLFSSHGPACSALIHAPVHSSYIHFILPNPSSPSFHSLDYPPNLPWRQFAPSQIHFMMLTWIQSSLHSFPPHCRSALIRHSLCWAARTPDTGHHATRHRQLA